MRKCGGLLIPVSDPATWNPIWHSVYPIRQWLYERTVTNSRFAKGILTLSRKRQRYPIPRTTRNNTKETQDERRNHFLRNCLVSMKRGALRISSFYVGVSSEADCFFWREAHTEEDSQAVILSLVVSHSQRSPVILFELPPHCRGARVTLEISVSVPAAATSDGKFPPTTRPVFLPLSFQPAHVLSSFDTRGFPPGFSMRWKIRIATRFSLTGRTGRARHSVFSGWCDISTRRQISCCLIRTILHGSLSLSLSLSFLLAEDFFHTDEFCISNEQVGCLVRETRRGKRIARNNN